MAYRHALLPSDGIGALGGASNISDGRITRVLFCVADNQMVLLHTSPRRPSRRRK